MAVHQPGTGGGGGSGTVTSVSSANTNLTVANPTTTPVLTVVGAPPNGAAGGDLTGTYPSPTLIAVGGGAAGPIGSATVTPVVTIDANGRVTALTTATIVPTNAAGGDLTGNYPNPTLAAIGSAAGPTGSATVVPVVTIDAKGRVTALTTATIVPTNAAGGDLTGNYPNPTLAAIGSATGPTGSTTVVPVVTIDAKGRVTALTTATIAAKVVSVAATDTSIVVAGTATAPTIATGTLDVIATQHPAAADWSNNSKAITSLLNIALAGMTGATAASRYVGATTSGAPGSGTFLKGDFVITQDGHIFVCTTAGTPGTWVSVGNNSTPQVFTSGGTWTPSTFGQQIFAAMLVGGGGGGGQGGAATSGAGGGGGQVIPWVYLGVVSTPQTITVGTAGAGSSGGNSTSGGNSSIGTLAVAAGGALGGDATGVVSKGGNSVFLGGGGYPGQGGAGSTSSTAGGFGGGGTSNYGAGGGAGGGPTSAAGGNAGARTGANAFTGGTGAALGGGGGASGSANGTNGAANVGGAGAAGAANTGHGGGGSGAGTSSSNGGAGGTGYVVIFQLA